MLLRQARFTLALAALGLLCLAAPARGQEGKRVVSSEDAALAETLFRDGRALLEGGQVDAACSKLEGSQKLDPKISTLMNVAACHELQGRTASAWAEFLEAARLTRVTPVRDPKALEQVARSRAEALSPRIHRIAIALPDSLPTDLELLVDGRPIPRAAWGTPIPVDPGEREILARRKGHAPWMKRVTISGEVRQHPLTVPALVPLPDPEPDRTGTPQKPETRSARLGTLPFIAGAFVAVAGIGAGSFLGLQAIEKKKERDRDCDATGCSEAALAKQDQAGTAAIGSTVAFGVGLAGAAFAAFWYLRPLNKTTAARGSTLTAACLSSSCAVSLSGSF